MCTDLFRSRRKKICGGVGGQRRSRAAKMHERLLPIHLAVPILAVLGGVALAGDPAPVIQNGLPTTVVRCSKRLEPRNSVIRQDQPRSGQEQEEEPGERVTRAGARWRYERYGRRCRRVWRERQWRLGV